MKKSLFLFTLTIILPIAIVAQSVTLKFTGTDASNYFIQLNKVVIKNLTCGWQDTILCPDNTLFLQNGNGNGIEELQKTSRFYLIQNTPNPFDGTTETTLVTENGGKTMVDIYDINGRLVVKREFHLSAGTHRIMIHLATANTYFLTANSNGLKTSIKMICNGGGLANEISYIGNSTMNAQTKKISNKPFSYGNQMEYIGYATINGSEMESMHITQAQNSSQTITLRFGVSLGGGTTCPGTPTLTDYDGNVYNTVKIGSQCWMKENLRTTHYANGGDIDLCLRDSSIYYTAHYFYPDNNSSNVSMAGLLYNQHAIMHGASCSNTNPSGVQGICPIGWHLPSNAEWEYMINYIGSQTQYLCGCDNNIYIAKSIASSIGWINGNFQYYTCSPAYDPSTNNSTGFSMFPAGTGTGIGFSSSSYFGLHAEIWSVSGTYDMLTNTYEQYMFGIGPYQGDAIIDHSSVEYAIGSVRCLKN